MHTFGIWIWCWYDILLRVLSYTFVLPQNYGLLRQSTAHTNTPYPLICYPHPPLIYYQFGLILTFFFSSNNMTWAFFCLAFLAFVSDFHFLLFIWSTGSTSSNSCRSASSFWTFSSQLSSSSHPVKTEILSGMLHLVLLGFRYASS